MKNNTSQQRLINELEKSLKLLQKSTKLVQDNFPYVLLGYALLANQFLESIIKNEIAIRCIKNKKAEPKRLDEMTLGQLIKELDKTILQDHNNRKIIKELYEFNDQRIKTTHKILNYCDPLPESFDLFMTILVKDKEITNELTIMLHQCQECSNSLKLIT